MDGKTHGGLQDLSLSSGFNQIQPSVVICVNNEALDREDSSRYIIVLSYSRFAYVVRVYQALLTDMHKRWLCKHSRGRRETGSI